MFTFPTDVTDIDLLIIWSTGSLLSTTNVDWYQCVLRDHNIAPSIVPYYEDIDYMEQYSTMLYLEGYLDYENERYMFDNEFGMYTTYLHHIFIATINLGPNTLRVIKMFPPDRNMLRIACMSNQSRDDVLIYLIDMFSINYIEIQRLIENRRTNVLLHIRSVDDFVDVIMARENILSGGNVELIEYIKDIGL